MNLIVILFWLLALLHFVPMISGLFPSNLEKLYGIAPQDQTHIVLMQHRAVLLGLVGAAFAAAAHFPSLRQAALLGGGFSMVSFLIMVTLRGQFSGPLRKIAIMDAAGLPLLILLFILVFNHKG